MAFGYFEVVEPGLTYVGRLSFRADPNNLPMDPLQDASPIEGEWVTVDASNHAIRPDGGTTPTLAAAPHAFPLLVDKSRTDTQSNQGQVTVLAHKGAICRTSVFATAEGDGSNITYSFGDLLTLASFLDEDLVTRVALAPASGLVVTSGGTAAGELTGYSSTPIELARIVRPPYTLSGVGVGNRRQVIDLEIL